MGKKSTIYDIAKLCEVSPATVSRVLNQPTLVSEETKSKVYTAMQQLEYSIKSSVSIDTSQLKDQLIIANIPQLGNPFYGEVVDGIKAAADRYNCDVLISSQKMTSASLHSLKAIVKSLHPIGMITTTINDPKLVLQINSILPVVQCCECCENVAVSSVSINDVAAAYSAIDYLYSLGKRRIAFINGPLDYKCDRDRYTGYKNALIAHNIEVIPSLITSLPDVNYSIAVSAASQMFSQENGILPDAIFASSDVYAIAAVRAAHLHNLSIPKDVAIIGFDNIDVSSISVPAITTVNQPRLQLGFSACELLFERIMHPEYPVKHMTLEAEMIVRESA